MRFGTLQGYVLYRVNVPCVACGATSSGCIDGDQLRALRAGEIAVQLTCPMCGSAVTATSVAPKESA